MASTYNRVGRPAVVAVRDGTDRLWLRRETVDDLERLEAADRVGPSPDDGKEGSPVLEAQE
jgi:hypothetical protein